ncbi:carbon-nitrogen family hydrolase [Aneurinibacillus sp. REN35]|uniref:carbon-nitrogen family hydrolase n=1 Tax=Aneurinibacillus sp. REN35 TaxID=3237286 RepID=UPI003529810E
MKVSLIQMDVKIGEPDYNFEQAQKLVEQAAKEKPDLIILPEMWNSGYALEKAQEVADKDGRRTRELFSALAKKHTAAIVAGSVLYEDTTSGNITNTMLVFDKQGQEIMRYDKLHLFRLMDEHLYLHAGDSFGVFELEGVVIGAMICYDLRFPQLSRQLVQRGASLLINVAQWPTPRVDHWKTLLAARAIENQSYMIAVNRCGKSRDTQFPGSSMVFGPWGEALLAGDDREQIYHIDIDIDKVAETRGKIPVFDDQRFDMYSK